VIDQDATFKNNINGDHGTEVAVGKNKVIFRSFENWLDNYEAIKTDQHNKNYARPRYNSMIVKSLDTSLLNLTTHKMLRHNGTFREVSLKRDATMKTLMPVNINITINSIIINLEVSIRGI
jgi:hypothetical protein